MVLRGVGAAGAADIRVIGYELETVNPFPCLFSDFPKVLPGGRPTGQARTGQARSGRLETKVRRM
jgi:hypothetical protein